MQKVLLFFVSMLSFSTTMYAMEESQNEVYKEIEQKAMKSFVSKIKKTKRSFKMMIVKSTIKILTKR